jgi:predicted DNA-binding antitoxin AbrB/MazE fold protein
MVSESRGSRSSGGVAARVSVTPIAALVESGLEAQDTERERFFQIAERLTNSTDPAEQKRIKKDLTRSHVRRLVPMDVVEGPSTATAGTPGRTASRRELLERREWVNTLKSFLAAEGGGLVKWTMKAVFGDGVFRPVQRPNLREGERVRLTVETVGEATDDVLGLAVHVYEGLSARDIDEIEDMAHHRAFFTDAQP